VVGRTTPDVYSNMWPGDVELYVEAGVLVPLDTFPDFAAVMGQRVPPDLLEEARARDGHIYQIPWKTNPVMMLYNTRLFAEAGYARPPVTYSEYLDCARRITQDTDGDGYIDRWMAPINISVTWWQRFFDYYTLYIAASGGLGLVKDSAILLDNDYSVGVFRFLREGFRRGYFPLEKAATRVDPFLTQRVASRFTGPWEIAHLERLKPPELQYDFAPVPRPDRLSETPRPSGPVYTYGDPKNIVIFSTTRFPRQAWQFAKFLTTRASDYKLLARANQLPIRAGLLEDPLFAPYFESHPKMRRFAEQARYIKMVDPCPVMKEIFDAISQEFEACVVYGVKRPEQAVTDAARRARLILETES